MDTIKMRWEVVYRMDENQAVCLQAFTRCMFARSHSPNICVTFLIRHIHILPNCGRIDMDSLPLSTNSPNNHLFRLALESPEVCGTQCT